MHFHFQSVCWFWMSALISFWLWRLYWWVFPKHHERCSVFQIGVWLCFVSCTWDVSPSPPGTYTQTHPWMSWALASAADSPDFLTFGSFPAVELAVFQLSLHWLFSLGAGEPCLSAQHYRTPPSCTAAPPCCFLHLHFFSGYLVTEIHHYLTSGHLSVLATMSWHSFFCCLPPIPVFDMCLNIFTGPKWYVFSTNHLIGDKCRCLHTLIISAAGLSVLAHLKLCTSRALKWKEARLLLMDCACSHSAFPSRAVSSGWPAAAFL